MKRFLLNEFRPLLRKQVAEDRREAAAKQRKPVVAPVQESRKLPTQAEFIEAMTGRPTPGNLKEFVCAVTR